MTYKSHVFWGCFKKTSSVISRVRVLNVSSLTTVACPLLSTRAWPFELSNFKGIIILIPIFLPAIMLCKAWWDFSLFWEWVLTYHWFLFKWDHCQPLHSTLKCLGYVELGLLKGGLRVKLILRGLRIIQWIWLWLIWRFWLKVWTFISWGSISRPITFYMLTRCVI